MLPRSETVRHRTPPANAGGSPSQSPSTDIGVGIDTSRYGHYAAFLDHDLQQAAGELEVAESAIGYVRLRQRFIDLVSKHRRVRFHVRIDVAGASSKAQGTVKERLAGRVQHIDESTHCECVDRRTYARRRDAEADKKPRHHSDGA